MIDRKVELAGSGYAVDRQKVMERISETRRAERQWRSRRTITYAAVAAAAVLLLSGGGLLSRVYGGAKSGLEVAIARGSATQWNGSKKAEIGKLAPALVPATGELETAASSEANVRTPEGVAIDLGAQTRVALGELQTKDRRLKLLRGAVRCAVPHQSAPERFQVVTPDATIIDIGTVFTVSLEGSDHATRVTVQEGEVLVRSAAGETHVKAPGSWSSAVTAPAQAPSIAAPEPQAPEAKPEPSPSAAPSPKPSHAAALPNATLDDEAQLLRQGLTAERQGRFSDARAALSTLLRKYPKSSVAPDARAALGRVEAREKQ
jgi:hypothetical protein